MYSFCDLLPAHREVTRFERQDVLFDVGDTRRAIFFLQSGFVKTGTITVNGHEVVHEVRKAGQTVGELCMFEPQRSGRAVALEQTDAIEVPYEEFKTLLMTNAKSMAAFFEIIGGTLREAYSQIDSLAADDTVDRLAKVLLNLACTVGRAAGDVTEIPIYLTQDEIAQMVSARRERISTALNLLRQRGMVQYSPRGKFLVNVDALGRLFAD